MCLNPQLRVEILNIHDTTSKLRLQTTNLLSSPESMLYSLMSPLYFKAQRILMNLGFDDVLLVKIYQLVGLNLYKQYSGMSVITNKK